MKKKLTRLLTFILAFVTVVSVMQIPTFAVAEKDKAQIKVSVSTASPQKGDTVLVTVELGNYATMTPKVSAMELSVKFDTSVFELVPDSIERNTLKINSGDILRIEANGDDQIDMNYCYANDAGAYLPRENISKFILFRFKLKVRDDLSRDKKAEFEITKCNIYDSHTRDKTSEVTCKTPFTQDVKAYVVRPDILFNESGTNEAVYDKMVKVEFNTATAQVTYESGEPFAVLNPFYAKENGTYVMVFNVNGAEVTQQFTVNREIKSISLKTGSYVKEYALNENLNLSKGELIVQYMDESPYDDENGISYIPLTDSHISVSGYDKAMPGEQALIVTYMNDYNTTMMVNVKNVSIHTAVIKPGSVPTYPKTPVGYAVDPAGIVVTVMYSDGTQEDRTVDSSMLGEYMKDVIGTVNVEVKLADEVIGTFATEYVSAENLNAFKNEVNAIDPYALTAKDASTVSDLKSRYATLSSQFSPMVFADITSKYNSIVQRMSEISGSIETTPATTPVETAPATQTGDKNNDENNGASTFKIVGWIIAVIILVSVLAGCTYFIVVYIKRKKEDEDYYYDDDDDDDDDMQQPTVAAFDYDDDDFISNDDSKK